MLDVIQFLKDGGTFHLKCYDENGNLKWEDEYKNSVLRVGKQLALDILFGASSKVTAWHAGLSNDNTAITQDYTLTGELGTRQAVTFTRTGESVDSDVASFTGIADTVRKAFIAGETGAGNPDITNSWSFDESSGSNVDDAVANNDLTLDGAVTYGSGFIQLDSINDDFVSANALDSVLSGDFSFAVWLEWDGTQGGWFFEHGTGQYASGTSQSFYCGITGSGINFHLSTSGGESVVDGNNTVTANQKILMILSYDRVGGASNNKLKIRWTQNGTNWYGQEITNAKLAFVNAIHRLHHRVMGLNNAENVFKIKYYRIDLYDKYLSDAEGQSIWDDGSEASLSSSVVFAITDLATPRVLIATDTLDASYTINVT